MWPWVIHINFQYLFQTKNTMFHANLYADLDSQRGFDLECVMQKPKLSICDVFLHLLVIVLGVC